MLARWNSRFSDNGVESVVVFAQSPLIIPQIRNFLPRTGSSFLPGNCSPDPGVVPDARALRRHLASPMIDNALKNPARYAH